MLAPEHAICDRARLAEDIAVLSGMIVYRLIEIRQSLSWGLERKLDENCH